MAAPGLPLQAISDIIMGMLIGLRDLRTQVGLMVPYIPGVKSSCTRYYEPRRECITLQSLEDCVVKARGAKTFVGLGGPQGVVYGI